MRQGGYCDEFLAWPQRPPDGLLYVSLESPTHARIITRRCRRPVEEQRVGGQLRTLAQATVLSSVVLE